MGVWGQIGRRLVETVEDRAGRQIVPRDRIELLESAEGEARVLRKTLEFIGFRLYNHPGLSSPWAMPRDLDLRTRIATAKEAHRAWVLDPQAGQHIDLYTSFVFGRGVPTIKAADRDVQKILDRAWDDPENRRVLTEYRELIALGVDLSIQASVPFLFHDDGEDGMCRASTLEFEDVLDVVRHPLQKKRILYYKVRERPLTFDFRTGQYRSDGDPRIVYYEAYGAFDPDSAVQRQMDVHVDLDLLRPPESMMRPGKVYMLAVNRTSGMAFGVPRMQRLVRWFTAYNELIEATVEKMKAAARLYVTATVRGNQNDLSRIAQETTGRRSTFSAAQEHAGGPPGPLSDPGRAAALMQNDSVRYEPFNINSGSSELSAIAPTLQGQASAQWPGHFVNGQAGSIAGATAMELPTLKFVEGEQELWRGPFRCLGESSIKAAIRVGDLDEWREPTELEVEKIAAAEAEARPVDGIDYDADTGLVRRDLTFEIGMPNPLKRAMNDVVAAVTEVGAALDPNGENVPLSRWMLLTVLIEAFDADDAARIVDEVLPLRPAAALAAEQAAAEQAQLERDAAAAAAVEQQRQASGANATGSTGADGRRHPADNPQGAPRRSPQPEERARARAPIREAPVVSLAERRRRARRSRAWEDSVVDVARKHLARARAGAG